VLLNKEIIVEKLSWEWNGRTDFVFHLVQQYFLEFRNREFRHREQGAPGVCSYYGNPTASLLETARTRLSFPFRCTVASCALLRLINSRLFTFAAIADRTKRCSLFVLLFPRQRILYFSIFSAYSRTSGRRLVLEIKGLAKQENLNQETHRAT